MDAPTWFTGRLEREFGGRLRVRWSPRKNLWCIEEKVGRAALPPRRIEEGDDDMVRARDGYALVLMVAPGDRLPCPICHRTLPIPKLEFVETECKACKAAKRAGGRLRAAYFPLDSRALLDHLHSIDPLRGANEGLLARVDAATAALAAERERVLRDGMYQTLLDGALSEIPKVGYTGRERYQ